MTTKINPVTVQAAADFAQRAAALLQTQTGEASHVEFLALLPLIQRAAELERDIKALATAIESDRTEGATK